MGQKIVYAVSVEHYLNNLVDILFRKDYFSYVSSADEYVEELVEKIESDISIAKHYNTPQRLKNHGKHYIIIKANRRTAWYVFFDKNDNRFLIRYITNNHVAEANFLKK